MFVVLVSYYFMTLFYLALICAYNLEPIGPTYNKYAVYNMQANKSFRMFLKKQGWVTIRVKWAALAWGPTPLGAPNAPG